MRLLSSVFLTLFCFTTWAQAPNWTINANAFQYNMTVTAVLDVNCVELTNPSNQLAAFENGILRGVANTSNVVGGRFIATMSVYSNQISGENITFQFYDLAADSIYTSIDSVIFQDNALYGTPVIPLEVKINNVPTQITLSNDSILENQPVGQLVGTLSSTDANANQTHTFSLVTGMGDTDNSLFSISGNQLSTGFMADFETKSAYTVRLKTTDSEGCFYEQALSVYVKNTNDAPSAIQPSANNLDENLASNTIIGNLSAVDQDVNETFTYSLVNGAGDDDNALFNLFGNALRTSQVFNFEVQSTFKMRVRVTDAAMNTYEDSLLVTVNDLNDTPTDIILLTDSVTENTPQNTLIDNLSTVDEDAAQSFVYTFDNVPGNDNDSFLIVGNQLRTNADFDFENRNQYFVYVQTNDLNGGVFTKLLVIRIIDANDVPTDINLSNASANENVAPGLFVGTIASTDQDPNSTFTYSLVNGVGDADNANFTIRNDSLFTAIMLNKNFQAQHTIRIATDDQNGGIYSKVFTIFVKDINNAPTSMSLSNSTIPENLAIGGEVGTLSSVDADLGDIHSYTLVAGAGGADNSAFQILGNKLQTNGAFDVNVQSLYSVRIQSNDGFGGTLQDTFKINIVNSNDAPTDILLSPSDFKEMQAVNSFIGNFTAVDSDAGDTHGFAFDNSGTNDNALFVISGNELKTSAQFDFETKNFYTISVSTTDALGASYSRQLTLNVLDSNDAPTNITLDADSLVEQSPKGTAVATIATVDADATDNFTYALIAGVGATDNALFALSGNTLLVDSVLDFNNGTQKSIRIQSTDKGGETTERAFTIRIVNRNDAPTALTLSNSSIPENNLVGSRLGSLSSVDSDANESFTYQLINGTGDTDNNRFTVVNDEIFTRESFDFETANNYSIRIRTTDRGGASFEESFAITIENQNEAPIIENQIFSIQENRAVGAILGTLLWSDVDQADVVSMRLLNGNDVLLIDPTSFELSSNTIFDFETQPELSVLAEVSDAGGLKGTAEITIIINDVVEGNLPAAGYFSPNGDGYNDTWDIRNVSLYSDYKINIFSANGQLVYEKAANYNNDWDGTINGTQLPEGVYYYFLENNLASDQSFKGTITLKR